MNREAKQELRRVLMGRTEPAPDGRLTAMEKGKIRVPLGISDGASAVRFLGIFRKGCRLKVSCPEDKARSLAAAVMRDCGRELILPQQPKAVACLIRYVFSRPAVLIFDFQDGVPVLTAWTGRGLTGLISVRRALKAFLKRMPKQFELSDKELPREQPEAITNQRKQRKKSKKKEQKGKESKPEGSEEAAVSDEAPNTTEEQVNESET